MTPSRPGAGAVRNQPPCPRRHFSLRRRRRRRKRRKKKAQKPEEGEEERSGEEKEKPGRREGGEAGTGKQAKGDPGKSSPRGRPLPSAGSSPAPAGLQHHPSSTPAPPPGPSRRYSAP